MLGFLYYSTTCFLLFWHCHTTTTTRYPRLRERHCAVIIPAAARKKREDTSTNDEGQGKVVANGYRGGIRKNVVNRKPCNYWASDENFCQECRDFWEILGVDDDGELWIPSESLLIKYKRFDLRAAISRRGGRASITECLNARIVPGKWKDALSLRIIRQLLEKDPSLTMQRSPASSVHVSEPIWKHKNARKHRGYWSTAKILTELYEYLDWYRMEHGRPAAWMPRLSELSKFGRYDLHEAIKRYGGTRLICKKGKLVAYREWSYFEGQLRILRLLKEYIDENGGDYSVFPKVNAIKRQGHSELHTLIQYYGGRKYLASRLGMAEKAQSDIDFGQFDLDFGLRLLQFVRDIQLERSPPLAQPTISMPSQQLLMRNGTEGVWLDEQISRFGGHENVARRLGLDF